LSGIDSRGEAIQLVAQAPPSLGARAYVAFSGGGAKGLVHVGALRALEDKAVEIKGYAGASAGAIVAALAAAGLRSTEMIDLASPSTLIDAVHKIDPSIRGLTDLFGKGGWPAIRTLRSAAQLIDHTPPMMRWVVAVVGGVAAVLVTLRGEVWFGAAGFWTVLGCWIAVITIIAYLGAGLARLNTLRAVLSKFLKYRVFGDANAAQEVTFADFDGSAKDLVGRTRPRLKIVASDISRKRLELFSSDTTPDTHVADAVCASVCIPFVFVPWRIKGVRYVDGGVVSNFPAWPFDEEKALDPDALTIGFQIGGPPGAAAPAEPVNRPVFWPVAVVQTALFGSRQLSTRAVGRAELITLPARLGLLDFDLRGGRARQEVTDVFTYALTQIDDRLFKFPAIYRNACSQVRDEVSAILAEDAAQVLRWPDPGPDPDAWVRCAVALQPSAEDFRQSLATLYGVGYDAFADGDLLWPIDGSLAGKAWTTKAPQFELDPVNRGVELAQPENRGLQRKLPKDLAWSLRVPMLATVGKPFLIVLVDGSGALQDNEPTREVIDALIDRIEEIFKPVVTRFKETASHGQVR
jgi:NTE family protein